MTTELELCEDIVIRAQRCWFCEVEVATATELGSAKTSSLTKRSESQVQRARRAILVYDIS